MRTIIATALMLIAAPVAAQEVVTAATTSATASDAVSAPILASGVASFYGAAHAGNRTASGERFNPNDMTAAHRTLPFGTRVKITDPSTGRSVVVRINDRGPFGHGRILDMSEGAARELGIHRKGRAHVEIAVAK